MNIEHWFKSVICGGSFFVLCLFVYGPLAFSQNQPAIEVFADGKRYGSMEQYKEAKRKLQENASFGSLVPVKTQNLANISGFLKDAVNKGCQSSVLTGRRYYLNPKDVDRYIAFKDKADVETLSSGSFYDPFFDTYRMIAHLGFNTGVARVVEDFREHIKDVIHYKRLMSKDLEQALSRSIGENDYRGPILIISHQKKLRIMTLQEQETGSGGNHP